jgi:hypothetical protein
MLGIFGKRLTYKELIMGAHIDEADPLLVGFFTLRDAARLLKMENTQRIRAC